MKAESERKMHLRISESPREKKHKLSSLKSDIRLTLTFYDYVSQRNRQIIMCFCDYSEGLYNS